MDDFLVRRIFVNDYLQSFRSVPPYDARPYASVIVFYPWVTVDC